MGNSDYIGVRKRMQKVMLRNYKKYVCWSILLIIIPLLIYFGGNSILKYFDSQWRPYVFTGLHILFSIGIFGLLILGIILLVNLYQTCKVVVKIGSVMGIICLLFLLFISSIYNFGVFAFSVEPEHIVMRKGAKCVACVNSFLDMNVSCYKYRTVFTMGEKRISYEWYGSGSGDPFDIGIASYESDILNYRIEKN